MVVISRISRGKHQQLYWKKPMDYREKFQHYFHGIFHYYFLGTCFIIVEICTNNGGQRHYIFMGLSTRILVEISMPIILGFTYNLLVEISTINSVVISTKIVLGNPTRIILEKSFIIIMECSIIIVVVMSTIILMRVHHHVVV